VTLRSGENLTGKVAWLTNDELALVGRENYGHSDMVVRVADIEHIEIREQSDGDIERRWFVGMGMAAVLSVLLSRPLWE